MPNHLIPSPISDTYVIEDIRGNRVLVRAINETPEQEGHVRMQVPLKRDLLTPEYVFEPGQARELAARLLDLADFADGYESSDG